MHSENKNKELIRKYISGDYTAGEWEEIRELMAKPESAGIFDQVLAERWTGLEVAQDLDKAAFNRDLQNFYSRLQEEEKQKHLVEPKKPILRRLNRRNLFQYAAIWAVLMIGAGWYIFQFNEPQSTQEVRIAMRELMNPKGQRSKVLLPDSSEVYLGADSKLSFPEQFGASSREVRLEGSAFFEVTKNPKKPFIIHTGQVQTRVLGTSFKIEAFKGKALTVSVATGKVRVDEIGAVGSRALAMLIPGQMLSYFKNRPSVSTTDIQELQSWKKARLNFHNQTLGEITAELERWYDVRISYSKPAKANEKISVMLQVDTPLNKMMNVLAATGHFTYKISGKQVNIK
ncbi:FecR family protein [Pedobacter sp. GR22-6]|uniref:FecR family protein n=1 Tax=Pedobacter sp. GR22-6 TaxID=3127957 RepID=UPI00307E09AC